MDKQIKVTTPLLPPLEEFNVYLQDIWSRKWLTNNGYYHELLEKELCRYLQVEHFSLFSNGTLALITALQALQISGEVITTPYSFVATTHALWWNGIKPIFVDIEPNTCNINPDKIEAAITEKTTAIMPVHVYGNPCNHEKIQKIADKYNLKIIYDAAHAFAVTQNEHSILRYGDLSILSFHATKTYSTIEGGAIICHSEEMKRHIDNLKNFGFRGETVVEEPGINAKLNEVQAAYGLASLKYIDDAIQKRKKRAEQYREIIDKIPGISYLQEIEGVKYNYSYFAVMIDEETYGISRDELYDKLKEENIFGRRYFYPLISSFKPYKSLPSAKPENLPIATRVADSVICLPMHHELTEKDVIKIGTILQRNKL
jgi:dTDP-4-amino-4,6-dideoxygalactose transaminase